jgi:hypothetical protein
MDTDKVICGERFYSSVCPLRFSFHAVLLDIDHSPKNLLYERHEAFYAEAGLRRLVAQIYPGGECQGPGDFASPNSQKR